MFLPSRRSRLTFYWLLALAAAVPLKSLRAQLDATSELPSAVRTADFTLSVSDVQTTTLVFPHNVVSVDRGTPDVLTQTLEEVLNVVKVKAADDQLDLTSLTVITTGGMVYTFRVRYDRYPTTLTYNLAGLPPPVGREVTPEPATSAAGGGPVQWEGPSPLVGLFYSLTLVNRLAGHSGSVAGDAPRGAQPNPMGLRYRTSGVAASQLTAVSRNLAAAGTTPGGLRTDRAVGSQLTLDNIWIGGDILYFRFTLANQSQIAYDVDFWRFYVVDSRRRVKRTAVQERDVELLNVYTAGDPQGLSGGRVGASATVTYVVALKKFTIPDQKNLVLELFERGGGRHHEITLRNRHIVTARLIAAVPN